MDVKDLERLKNGQPEYGGAYFERLALEGIERYAAEGEVFEANLAEEEFEKIIALLSLDQIAGEDILRFRVESTMLNGGTNVDSEKRGFNGYTDPKRPVQWWLNHIADLQSVWEDNENDFRATMMVKFDEATIAAIGFESQEVIVVCDECVELARGEGDEAEIAQINNAGFSCEHRDSEYSYKYWVSLFKAEDIDNYPEWSNWDMEFVDTVALAAEDDRLAYEREQREGLVNLARLKKDESLAITTLKGEEKWEYLFRIVKPGKEPLCSVFASQNGVASGPGWRVRLRGGGHWTTPQQNPVQQGSWDKPTQELALSVFYGYLRLESDEQYVMVFDPKLKTHLYLQHPVESITLHQHATAATSGQAASEMVE